MLDGKFFSLVVEKSSEQRNQAVGRCTLCENTKEIKGQFSASTNFLKHLKRTYGQKAIEDYQKYVEGK
jgi:hypothetical protein